MKIRSVALMILLLAGILRAAANPPLDEGKTIFTSRCAACHNINRAMTGPALAGVDQRHSIDWIINFIHSPQAMIKKGDTLAVALFEKFNKIIMPDHPDLTTDNIKSVIEYIKSEAAVAGAADKAPFAKPGKKRDFNIPLSIQKNYGFFLGYLAVVVMLIMALLLAVHLNDFKRKAQGEKDSA